MSKKIDVRSILKKHQLGLSENKIAKACHVSKHSIKSVLDRCSDLEFDLEKTDEYSDDDLYRMFFPDKYESENFYSKPNYEYVHNELKKPGVTLHLIWEEYKLSVPSGMYAYGYTTFCRGYAEYVGANNLTNHLIHKPGETAETDWLCQSLHNQSYAS